MRRFYEIETVIASEAKQSAQEMDRRTSFAMTEENDEFEDEDDEEYEREWCD